MAEHSRFKHIITDSDLATFSSALRLPPINNNNISEWRSCLIELFHYRINYRNLFYRTCVTTVSNRILYRFPPHLTDQLLMAGQILYPLPYPPTYPNWPTTVTHSTSIYRTCVTSFSCRAISTTVSSTVPFSTIPDWPVADVRSSLRCSPSTRPDSRRTSWSRHFLVIYANFIVKKR